MQANQNSRIMPSYSNHFRTQTMPLDAPSAGNQSVSSLRTMPSTAKSLLVGLVASCFATVAWTATTDVAFVGIATQIAAWTQGTLGATIRLGALLVGFGLAVKTQRLPIPLSFVLATIYFPQVVDTIFAATI